MSWLTAIRNEAVHEWDVLASTLRPKCDQPLELESLPNDLVGRVVRSGRSWEGTIAFEPQTVAFERLVRNTRNLPNVRCIDAAVSDISGTAHLIHPQKNRGASRVSIVSGDESIRLCRLDDFAFPRLVGLIKIDVEGHEAEVLEGAAQLLQVDRPVVVLEDKVNSRAHLRQLDYGVCRISMHDFICIPMERAQQFHISNLESAA